VPADRATIERRLRELGDAPVPEPSPAFVARLERRLVDEPATTTKVVAIANRRRATLPAALGIAATIAAALLATALLGGFDQGGGTRALRLGAAVNTTVRLPGGQVVAGKSGLELPNGAVVRTGPNGSAAAGTVDLGPGIQATVASGRLHLTPTPTAAPTRPAATPPPAVTLPSVTLPAITLPKVTVPALTVPTTLPHLP
jgi:hypothetical protein